MRIAFYAPMKAANHPVPSGDRSMARLLVAALQGAGHTIETASQFSTFDAAGDVERQRRIGELSARAAERLLRRWQTRAPANRPELWFTYHNYHKAPDWLGPRISRALEIPYVVAEASYAGKQAAGRWAFGHAAAARAIAAANLLLGLNSADTEGVRLLLSDPWRLRPLSPFIDCRPYSCVRTDRAHHRRTLCERYAIDEGQPLLLSVAMMRAGDKLASYRLLAEALSAIADRPWRLLIAGDGPACPLVREAFASFVSRIVWLSRIDEEALPALYAAADLYVWPAIGEAWGMTLLEAQAAGLPVVAGQTGGVADVVADGEAGLLVPVGCASSFAGAVAALLDQTSRRLRMGERAAARIAARHDLAAASRALDAALRSLMLETRAAQA